MTVWCVNRGLALWRLWTYRLGSSPFLLRDNWSAASPNSIEFGLALHNPLARPAAAAADALADLDDGLPVITHFDDCLCRVVWVWETDGDRWDRLCDPVGLMNGRDDGWFSKAENRKRRSDADVWLMESDSFIWKSGVSQAA